MSQEVEYSVFYWPGIPGRGEFARLAFEHAKTKYNDIGDIPELLRLLSNKDVPGIAAPHFAVPVLGVRDKSMDKMHYISQVPAQLSFLAPRLGLLGDADKLQGLERDVAVAQIYQLCATALDMNTETHDTHHPISVSSLYEDQKKEAKKRAADFRTNRVPKFLQLFEVALSKDGAGVDKKDSGKKRMYGSKTTVADLAVFQVLDGLLFAFPKCLGKHRSSGEYKHVFELYDEIKGELKEYLDSDRRRPYSDGIFRHYPELDDE